MATRKRPASASTKRAPRAAQPSGEDIRDEIDVDAELVATRYTISAYGADFPVDGLVKRMLQNDIVVPTFDPNVEAGVDAPGFQRNFVWTKRQCDRFVESLLFGFPVPGIFLFRGPDNKLLVVDGQQRLKTLESFCGTGVLNGQEYRLTEVHKEWVDRRYADLVVSDRRRLDDTIIHATIIRQEEPSADLNSVYLIFERLNTGGTALSPQQIRVALYRGPFVEVMRNLNNNDDWRALIGKRSKTLKDQELLLRFFALLHNRSKYARPMKEFLNTFLQDHRNLGPSMTQEHLVSTFEMTLATIRQAIGDRAFRLESVVNAALADAVLVGVADRVMSRGELSPAARKKLSTAYDKLLRNEDFKAAVTRATADEEAVKTRLNLAIRAFA